MATEHDRTPSFFEPHSSSPLVPISMISTDSSELYGSSAMSTPQLSAPTNPASLASRWMLPDLLISTPRSRAFTSIAGAIAVGNGATPTWAGLSRSRIWCMAVLHTRHISRMSSRVMPASFVRLSTNSLSALIMASFILERPVSGFCIA